MYCCNIDTIIEFLLIHLLNIIIYSIFIREMIFDLGNYYANSIDI